MTHTNIDTLAEWWENAEQGDANPGDHIIERHVCDQDGDVHYTIGTHRKGMRGLIGKSGTRILLRAEKPKPAWHDAVAVVAGTNDFTLPRVFVKDENGIWNDALAGRGHSPESLLNVTPLIEQKVTDEMACTVLNGYYEMDGVGHDWPADTVTLMRLALTAALGLETE